MRAQDEEAIEQFRRLTGRGKALRLGSPFKASGLNKQARYFNDAKSSADAGGWLLIIHKVIVCDRLNATPKRPKVKSSSLAGKENARAWTRERSSRRRRRRRSLRRLRCRRCRSNEIYSISAEYHVYGERGSAIRESNFIVARRALPSYDYTRRRSVFAARTTTTREREREAKEKRRKGGKERAEMVFSRFENCSGRAARTERVSVSYRDFRIFNIESIRGM